MRARTRSQVLILCGACAENDDVIGTFVPELRLSSRIGCHARCIAPPPEPRACALDSTESQTPAHTSCGRWVFNAQRPPLDTLGALRSWLCKTCVGSKGVTTNRSRGWRLMFGTKFGQSFAGVVSRRTLFEPMGRVLPPECNQGRMVGLNASGAAEWPAS